MNERGICQLPEEIDTAIQNQSLNGWISDVHKGVSWHFQIAGHAQGMERVHIRAHSWSDIRICREYTWRIVVKIHKYLRKSENSIFASIRTQNEYKYSQILDTREYWTCIHAPIGPGSLKYTIFTTYMSNIHHRKA